jgi:hypothetical protein
MSLQKTILLRPWWQERSEMSLQKTLLLRPKWQERSEMSLQKIQVIFNPLNAELNPNCHLLALLGGATIVVVSRLRVNPEQTEEVGTVMEKLLLGECLHEADRTVIFR